MVISSRITIEFLKIEKEISTVSIKSAELTGLFKIDKKSEICKRKQDC